MRPLDRLRSIKLKLGIVIVASVATTMVVNEVGLALNIKPGARVITAMALALGMIQLLARGMTSPLREMARAAKAMALGDYSRHVTASSRDEVGDLARAFNEMAAELAEVDRFRRDLVANASHELRTPLTALQAKLENLVDGVEPADSDAMRAMLRQVERLGRLVAQLLDLSRLESGAVPLERAPFAIGELVGATAEEIRMHTAGVLIDVDVPVELEIDGDRERIHQVVANLLSNAVRHSPAGEPISVAAHRDGSRTVIEVCDRGPGIAPGDEHRVFERFYRADAARNTDDGGTGLGLAISRWIVELHGGEIWVEPNRPHGCRMVVELPAGSSTSGTPVSEGSR
jgi:signal transduction histidine kinase